MRIIIDEQSPDGFNLTIENVVLDSLEDVEKFIGLVVNHEDCVELSKIGEKK